MINGIINIHKEKGISSAGVVSRLKGILHQKKIGHTGTLDPEAEGVLPVCLGQATKLTERLADKTKEYICTCRLGLTTDTEDMCGEVLTRSEVSCETEELCKVLESFVGDYDQVPPMYSALKKDGRRLYELARQGVVVERPARRLKIHELELLSAELPCFSFRVLCSRGTYVRSLCRDIGEKLGCGGAMESLVRSRSGEFSLDTALYLSEVEELAASGRLAEHIFSVEHFYEDCPVLKLLPEAERFLQNGNALYSHNFQECPLQPEAGLYRICDAEGRFSAVYRYEPKQEQFVPETMYL
ncbi:MAG: tRNA pseudouridine(55) synthase TruB [Lachnospiraceae bacterium]|nr:tRNA pseudouridine(55) synthase TruB [Lachnospiraceae bacterium]